MPILSVGQSVCLSLEKMSKIVKNQDFVHTAESESYQSCWIGPRYISRFIACLSISLSIVKCQIEFVKIRLRDSLMYIIPYERKKM